MTYFSERETGEVPRNVTEITDTAWGGITALFRSRIADGSFGASYPEICQDVNVSMPIGTDENAFWDAIKGDIPQLAKREWILAPEPPPVIDEVVV